MLDTVFYLVLNLSLTGALVIAALLLVRLVKPLPRRVVYPLWLLALIRLVWPFALSSRWSLFNLTGGLVKRLVTVENVVGGLYALPPPVELYSMNHVGAAQSYQPFSYKTESLRQLFGAAALVWVVVALALLLAAVALHVLTRVELNKATHLRGNRYRSEQLLSPVLVGVFRVKIILPVGLDPDSDEGRMVIAHENVHRRRLDNLWRTLAVVVACLHWFNPLVWIALKAFFTDMELSCDAAVLREGRFAAADYAAALLRFAERKRFAVSTGFGGSRVKVRIVNVLHYKRMGVIGGVASAVFLLALTLILLTNPTLMR